MRSAPRIVMVAFGLLIFPTTAHPLNTSGQAVAPFGAQVVGILDGDTIEVLHNLHPTRIRLNGIDCPEKGQAFGKRAKQAASDLAFGKDVTLQIHGLDKYKRTIADVTLPDGRMLNQELVKDGWCWWYRKYAPNDTALEKLESEAREAKRGLWADPNPVPPWVWRKTRRGQSLTLEDLLLLDPKVAPDGLTRGPPVTGELNDAHTLTSSLPIIGNRRSHLYHRPDCPNYSSISLHNQVFFGSALEAEEAGYRKAGNCP